MFDEKLLLELKKYFITSYQNKVPINANFIQELGRIFITNLNLDNYIKEIQVKNLNNKDLGQYIRSRNIVTYDLARVIHLLNSVKDLNLSSDSKDLYYYVSVLEFLAHEIEHANQYKKIYSKENSLENKILTHSLMFKESFSNEVFYRMAVNIFGETKIDTYFNQKFNAYINNHDLAPEEKLANYYAINLILEILKEFPHHKDLINFKKYILLKYLMLGYDITLSPTTTYLNKLNIYTSNEFNEDNLSLARRLSLGLKISPDEREKLNLITKRLAKNVYHY